jgi:hypothetical protein
MYSQRFTSTYAPVNSVSEARFTYFRTATRRAQAFAFASTAAAVRITSNRSAGCSGLRPRLHRTLQFEVKTLLCPSCFRALDTSSSQPLLPGTRIELESSVSLSKTSDPVGSRPCRRFTKHCFVRPRQSRLCRVDTLKYASCVAHGVELIGFEPTTLGLQSRCSPN